MRSMPECEEIVGGKLKKTHTYRYSLSLENVAVSSLVLGLNLFLFHMKGSFNLFAHDPIS